MRTRAPITAAMMRSARAVVLNSVRTRLAQLVPHVDRALSQLPATARVPAERLFAQSKHVVNRMQPPPPDSELSAQLEWTFKADVHSAAALSASIASTMADRRSSSPQDRGKLVCQVYGRGVPKASRGTTAWPAVLQDPYVPELVLPPMLGPGL